MRMPLVRITSAHFVVSVFKKALNSCALEPTPCTPSSAKRFFISGLDVNANQPAIDRLRKKGRLGPLWEFFNLAR